MLNPIEHSKTKDSANKYKVEPYVMSADVYSNKNLIGRGGWTWYTGSSSWYIKTVIEYVLGLKVQNNYLYINPCISKDWKEYKIQYKYKNSVYNIHVKNLDSKNTGVSKMMLNGKELEDKKVLLQENMGVNNIEIVL